MQIIGFLNWNLGFLVLDFLTKQGMKIDIVVTNYDLEDKDEYRNKVYKLAQNKGIEVFNSYKQILGMVDSNAVGFSVAYGNEIFHDDILTKLHIYNFHPSKLPSYKGGAPLQWQIKKGEIGWGMSCHEVTDVIDGGAIVECKEKPINRDESYEKNLDNFNKEFSQFIAKTIMKISESLEKKGTIETFLNTHDDRDYYPIITIPHILYDKPVRYLQSFLNRERAVIFAGNRAELGILLPIIFEMCQTYYVDVMIADTFFINADRELDEVKRLAFEKGYAVNFTRIALKEKDNVYYESLGEIYTKLLKYFRSQEKYCYDYAVVLGDRIESLGFSLAAFYSKIPLVHIAGGDIANVPYYDTNVRHVISKLASLHFPLSEESKKTLQQMGEEEERICVIGNPSFDYRNYNLLIKREEIDSEFDIGENKVVIFTYHASPFMNDEQNLKEYILCLDGVVQSDIEKIIITYPNNDPGSALIYKFLDKYSADQKRIFVRKSLGTVKMQSIMNCCRAIIVGNSSSGLLETLFYLCPAINIGDRQTDRTRGGNVVDVLPNTEEIMEAVNSIVEGYDELRIKYKELNQIFGDGTAAVKACLFLEKYKGIENEELIVKQFVKGDVK